MSLLNDALRRASTPDPDRPDGASPVPPLQPAEYPAEPHWSSRFLLVVLLVMTVGASAFFMVRWLRAPAQAPPEAGPTAALDPRLLPAPAPSPDPRDAPSPEPAVPLLQVNSPPPVLAEPTAEPAPIDRVPPAPAASTGAAVQATPAPAATEFPTLKLQSIIFRMRKPSVVINGEMLGVGDLIEGARVVRIERQAVTLEWKGQTNVLSLRRL